jgi:anti-sigma regulatory factor (Ser/Thr protein kinase)
MRKTYTITRNDMDTAGTVSSDIKRILKDRNVQKKIIRKVAIASYEAEINIVIHSIGGAIELTLERDYLRVDFIDFGPGIPSIKDALREGYSTASDFARNHGFGAGMGLPNIRNIADDFEIKSSINGTHLQLGFILSYEH